MIIGFFGQPGSGKTTLATKKLIEVTQEKCRQCRNVNIFTNVVGLGRESETLLEKLMGGGYKNFRIYKIDSFFGGNLVRMAKHAIEISGGNVDKDFFRDSIYFLDEIQNIFPKGPVGKNRFEETTLIGNLLTKPGKNVASATSEFGEDLSVLEYLRDSNKDAEEVDFREWTLSGLYEYHRHLGVDIIFTCQHQVQLLRRFYELVGESHYIKKISDRMPFIGFLVQDKLYSGVIKGENLNLSRFVFKGGAKKAWELLQGVKLETTHKSKWIIRIIWIILAIIVISAFTFAGGWLLFFDKMGEMGKNGDKIEEKKNLPQNRQEGQGQDRQEGQGQDRQEGQGQKRPTKENATISFSFKNLSCFLKNVLDSGGFLELPGRAIIGDKVYANLTPAIQGENGLFYPLGNDFHYDDILALGVRLELGKNIFSIHLNCDGKIEKYTQAYYTIYQANEIVRNSLVSRELNSPNIGNNYASNPMDN